MKFYRLHKRAEAGTSFGCEFFTTKRDAEDAARAWLSIRSGSDEEPSYDDIIDYKLEAVEIEPTKAGILAALKRYASHPDNG